MKVVIIESPHKAKTISKYLGKDYHVLSSIGHIRDLSISGEENLGVDVHNNFEATYDIAAGKSRLIANLKKEVAKASEVILATDPDREGEAISWHLAEVLNLDVNTTKRVEYHELTARAIKESFASPRHINMNLVSSQETRRILDRIIGFKLSTLLQRKIHSRSAGRVQSVVLKLIVDKEEEVKNFNVEEYYTISGRLFIDDVDVNIKLVNDQKEIVKFKSIEEANEVITLLKRKEFQLLNIEKSIKKQYSKPAFTTSTLQQDAYNLFKFDSKKTMKIAQGLYEGVDLGKGPVGFITYMRTDSVRLSPLFISLAKKHISEQYGEEYVGFAKIDNKSSNNVQDAHEAIRPTDVNLIPEIIKDKLTKDQEKLYRLIYYRAICSMMKEEEYEVTEVLTSCEGYKFIAVGEETIFDGYKKAYKNVLNETRNSLGIKVNQNSVLGGHKLTTKAEKTKAPARYNEARLIQTMEKLGIGRPSTYASTLDTIKARNYVKIEGGYYLPSTQGIVTTKKLVEYFPEIINVEYTSKMETELDMIAEGKMTKLEALDAFYPPFEAKVKEAYKLMPQEVIVQEDLGNCPQCGKPLVTRNGRFGSFIACSGYPNCHYIAPKEDKEGQPCPDCKDGHLVKKRGPYGQFYACSNYPNCKHVEK